MRINAGQDIEDSSGTEGAFYHYCCCYCYSSLMKKRPSDEDHMLCVCVCVCVHPQQDPGLESWDECLGGKGLESRPSLPDRAQIPGESALPSLPTSAKGPQHRHRSPRGRPG